MKMKIAICLLVFQLLVSCSSNPTQIPNSTFDIPELEEYYEPLMKEAQTWSPDAYLYKVIIPIGQKSWVLSASLYSSAKDDQGLQILLDQSGKFTQRRFQYESGVLQQEPILRDQWEIGSRDALSGLVSENIDSIQSLGEVCGSLVLVRVASLPDQPLVWILNYNDCALPLSNTQSYLDPVTGNPIKP